MKKVEIGLFIVYPESAPDNWRELLDGTHLRWVESPLHDKDLNADGTVKNRIGIFFLTFEGPVTLKAVEKIVFELNCPQPRKVGSSKGLVRYMIHLDNPENISMILMILLRIMALILRVTSS